MVRVKYRYVLIQLKTYPQMVTSSDILKSIIYDITMARFGLKTAVHLHNLQIIDTYENNICIFKVLREVYKNVIVSLTECKGLKKLKTEIKLINVSGSVKGIKIKMIKYLNKIN